jgi:hypothetical protein
VTKEPLIAIRGEDLRVGMTVKVAGRMRTITWIKWGEAPWMLEPGDPRKIPAAKVEADANFAWTAYPTDHYERLPLPGEAIQERLVV